MVVALGPGKFYGSSLPRPRFYTDVKLNDARVDPPPSVMDPFLSWANDAHWSMGGLNFVRHRLQGRIEGSIKKLRSEQELVDRKSRADLTPPPPAKTRFAGQKPANLSSLDLDSKDNDEKEEEARQLKKGAVSLSLPNRKRARRLGDEFDGIAAAAAKPKKAKIEVVASRTRSQKLAAAVAEETEIGEEESSAIAPLHKKQTPDRKKRKEAIATTPRRTSPRQKQSKRKSC